MLLHCESACKEARKAMADFAMVVDARMFANFMEMFQI